MTPSPRSLCILALVLPGLLGCGYRFVDETRVFGPDVQQIRIRAFENRSQEPGYEQMLLGSFGEEFVRRGALRPVYGGSGGDLVLAGMIRDVEVTSASFSSVELAVEDSIAVSIDVQISRSPTGEIVYERERYRFAELFSSSPDPQTYESNKEQALRRLAALIAERVHDELFQGL